MKKKTMRRMLYTVLVITGVYALSRIPVTGVSRDYLSAFLGSSAAGTFMDDLAGGTLSQLSLGTFGISSYITASIVIQLLMVIFPSLEKLRKDGERGRRIFEKAELALGIALAAAGSATLSIAMARNGMLAHNSWPWMLLASAEWTAASFVIMKLALSIEEKGIGNGPSLLLAFNIISRIPSRAVTLYDAYLSGHSMAYMLPRIGASIAMLAVLVIMSVWLSESMLDVRILMTGKKSSVFSADGYIPMPVNIANVLPVIYAQTVISMPTMIATLTGKKLPGVIASIVDMSEWHELSSWKGWAGIGIYLLLLFIFGFFGSGMSFSADEIADTMRRNGDVMPGVNPGTDTANEFRWRQRRLTVISVIVLGILTLVPDIIADRSGMVMLVMNGTSLVIVAGVLMDEARRIVARTRSGGRKFRLFPKGRRIRQ